MKTLTLVIQTVFTEPQILILNSGGQLGESVKWKSDRDEIKKVIPEIETILNAAGYEWQDISRIVSTVGTGNFSATRIGVTIANILAMATSAEIYELQLDQALGNEDLAELIAGKFKKGWKKSALAKPVYQTAPVISPSKKKLFNN